MSVFDECDNPQPSKEERKQMAEIERMNEELRQKELEELNKQTSGRGSKTGTESSQLKK